MTKTIVFDLDGVLCDFIGPAVKKGYELAGRSEPENWAQSCWDDYGGLTKPEIAKLWEYIRNHPGFWYNLPPLANIEEIADIGEFADVGHAIYFATNRRFPYTIYMTRKWLQRYGVLNPVVVITKRKGEFCRCVDADYYIDDKSENVDCAIWLTDGKTKAYVMDSPTNRGQYAPHSSKAGRVHSISEFLEEVNREV